MTAPITPAIGTFSGSTTFATAQWPNMTQGSVGAAVSLARITAQLGAGWLTDASTIDFGVAGTFSSLQPDQALATWVLWQGSSDGVSWVNIAGARQPTAGVILKPGLCYVDLTTTPWNSPISATFAGGPQGAFCLMSLAAANGSPSSNGLCNFVRPIINGGDSTTNITATSYFAASWASSLAIPGPLYRDNTPHIYQ
jgi:hypothetical protein